MSTFHQLLFIILPLSAILAVLRIPIVRLIYGASSFPWETTVLTGQILIIFSLSLFAQVLNLLLSRAFYAMHDAKTPLVVTLTSIIINISLSIFFILIKGFPVHFLAFSFTAASIFQAIFLFLLLAKKLGGFKLTEIISSSVKIAIASLLMAVALYIPMKLLDQLVFDTTRTVPLILLTGTAGLSGLLVYAFFAWLFRIGQLTPVLSLLRRFGKIPKAREEVEVINGGARTNP
ncbi:polysaccharide biosynthesis C-terminal domain-containing protein [Candidatus Microgenomates bacterium]|nr:polysaccharide biosynthesis C-terminal domain-containing protein [Candidatus Microgenomates bacterium]